MDINHPQELALHGLLLSAAVRENGGRMHAIRRIRDQAALIFAHVPVESTAAQGSQLPICSEDHLLLAQAVMDHQAGGAQVQVWQHLQAQHPSLASLADQLCSLSSPPLLYHHQSPLAEGDLLQDIICDIPAHGPPHPWLIPVAPIIGFLFLISAAAAIALARAPDPAALHFLLLLLNAMLLSFIAAIGLRALRPPLAHGADPIETAQAVSASRLSRLIHARLRPAPAAALMLAGLVAPAFIWLQGSAG